MANNIEEDEYGDLFTYCAYEECGHRIFIDHDDCVPVGKKYFCDDACVRDSREE
jgi:hypothetical protein